MGLLVLHGWDVSRGAMAFGRCTGPATPTSMQDNAVECLSAHSRGSPNNVETHCKLCSVQQLAARVGLKRWPPDAGGAFGSVAFPSLGVLAAEGLF